MRPSPNASSCASAQSFIAWFALLPLAIVILTLSALIRV
jgi:hypothetical protein